jgi:sortase A
MTSTEAPRRRRGRARRRLLTVVGLALILTGLGFLGYVGWQYFGTNVVAKQQQAEVKQVLKDDWGKGLDGDAIGLLRVDRFGDDYEIPIVPGFDDDALSRGVGWDKKGARPGEIGNVAVAGHRVTHGEPFRDFLKLRKGDLVEIETRTNVYTYELRQDGDAITVDFTVGWPLQRVPDPDKAGERPTASVLTLLTCSELFHTRNRNVVIGDLVSDVDKSTASDATTG